MGGGDSVTRASYRAPGNSRFLAGESGKIGEREWERRREDPPPFRVQRSASEEEEPGLAQLFGQLPQMLQWPALSVPVSSCCTPEYAAFITASGAKWIVPLARTPKILPKWAWEKAWPAS